jgi:hypothetical protein
MVVEEEAMASRKKSLASLVSFCLTILEKNLTRTLQEATTNLSVR